MLLANLDPHLRNVLFLANAGPDPALCAGCHDELVELKIAQKPGAKKARTSCNS